MDLALAHCRRAQARSGTAPRSTPWQLRALTYALRAAPRRSCSATPTHGSSADRRARAAARKLIGGTIRTELTRDEVERDASLDGFFPQVEAVGAAGQRARAPA